MLKQLGPLGFILKLTFMQFANIAVVGILLAVSDRSYGIQQEIPLEQVSEVSIVGQSSKFQIVPGPAGAAGSIGIIGKGSENWKLSMEGQKLSVSESIGLNPTPNVDTQIIVKLPAKVALKMALYNCNGSVSGDYSSVMELSCIKGIFHLNKVKGSLKVTVQKGEIHSSESSGDLEIETYSAKTTVKDFKGALKLNSFSGDSQLEGIVASLKLESHSGSTRLSQYEGSAFITMARSTLSGDKIKGRLEGDVKDASLNLNLLEDAEADFKFNAGKLNVSLPASSGAYLSLMTRNGDLYAPAPLKPYRESNYKTIKGRLQGSVKGSIRVRGEDTSIFIK